MQTTRAMSWRAMAAFAIALATCAVGAHHAVFLKVWVGGPVAAFEDPFAWSPPGAPGPLDQVRFDGGSGPLLSVSMSADRTNDWLEITAVDVVMDMATMPPGEDWALTAPPMGGPRSVRIGDATDDTASLTILNGRLLSRSIDAGTQEGATGILRLDGAGASLRSLSALVRLGRFGGVGVLELQPGTSAELVDLRVGEGCPGQPVVTPPYGIGAVHLLGGTLEVTGAAALRRGLLELADGAQAFLFMPTQACSSFDVIGSGLLVSPSFSTSGGIEPGRQLVGLPNPGGDLQMSGNVILRRTGDDGLVRHGSITTRLSGAGCTDASILDVGGTLDLSGALSLVVEGDCAAPPLAPFDAIIANTIVGAPDVLTLAGTSPDAILTATINDGTGPGPGSVVLSVTSGGSVTSIGVLSSTTLGGEPVDLVVDDLDANGLLDLAIAVDDLTTDDAGSIAILLDDGSGFGFDAPVFYAVAGNPKGIAAGRIDADADVDLVVVTGATPGQPSPGGPEGPATGGPASLIELENDGSGTFTVSEIVNPNVDFVDPTDVALANFDAADQSTPGVVDVVVTDGGADEAIALQNDGNGDYSVLLPWTLPLPPRPRSVDPADLDNDKEGFGWDLAFACEDADVVSIYRNDGGVTGSDPFVDEIDRVDLGVDEAPIQLLVDDLGGDGGPLELVVRSGDETSGAVTVIPRVGTAFGNAATFPITFDGSTRRPTWLDLEDVDDDGDLDVLLVSDEGDATDSNVLLLRNDSAAGFIVLSSPDEIDAGPEAALVKGADLDADGDAEVVVVDRDAGTGPGLGVVEVYGDDPCVPADLDCSGSVDFADILSLLSSWGPCGLDCPADLDGSGSVDFGDLLIVLASWG